MELARLAVAKVFRENGFETWATKALDKNTGPEDLLKLAERAVNTTPARKRAGVIKDFKSKNIL